MRTTFRHGENAVWMRMRFRELARTGDSLIAMMRLRTNDGVFREVSVLAFSPKYKSGPGWRGAIDGSDVTTPWWTAEPHATSATAPTRSSSATLPAPLGSISEGSTVLRRSHTLVGGWSRLWGVGLAVQFPYRGGEQGRGADGDPQSAAHVVDLETTMPGRHAPFAPTAPTSR